MSEKTEMENWWQSLTVDERQHLRWIYGTPGEGYLTEKMLIELWRVKSKRLRTDREESDTSPLVKALEEIKELLESGQKTIAHRIATEALNQFTQDKGGGR